MSEKRAGCPICAKPIDLGFRPFCSKHCADLDLHRWFSGRYAILASAEDDSEAERPAEILGEGED
jgi:uncharacterized protein